ncbi:Hypothetical protein PHPALM_16963 [Phytophthora palmivora]|uniref:Reverse transcriptase/retrotransposon-derived protein RNase H-like domain-containing protein n=1 Tax=Phytophthora palmivora TaxID=4796 RepID=A0A2P4XNH1_9STRA|nr:Hypothetical protein PHPALM_16963 [Phytophthora palmivora]
MLESLMPMWASAEKSFIPQGVVDSLRAVQPLLVPVSLAATGEGDEFLLGRDALKELGIDVEGQLAQNISKCSLFEIEVRWRESLIYGDGIRRDPSRVEALTALPLPETIVDTQYFDCATNCLQDSLPDYARSIAQFNEKLNAEHKRVGSRNRDVLNVATTWVQRKQDTYAAVKPLVHYSVLIAPPAPKAELLVFTDASLMGYSIMVTQVVDWDPFCLS